VGIVVQKYGGTSVADVDRIRNVARRVVETVREGQQVAVVVSAMAGETDQLVAYAREIAGDEPDPREYDMLVSTGEQKTIALLAMAIQRLGCRARSFTGGQMGMRTDGSHTRARIESIDARRLREFLDSGAVAVVAGFQGIDDAGNITTLGRGGSDTSAVAVAAALGADVCEIYTDVDGVFTSDPRLVPAARKLDRIAYDEMLEMASLGAKVLQIRSVQFAMRYRVPLHVRSSFKPDAGTWVVPEEEVMEGLVVSGVTYNRDEAKIRVRGVKDQPGIASGIFTPLSEAGIVVDMIIQNLSQDGTTDVTFTVGRGDFRRAMRLAEEAGRGIGAAAIDGDDGIAKVSIVGLGMKDHAGVASLMFRVLADEGINIQLISTSEIKVSVVIDQEEVERAVGALHAAFLEAGAAEPRPEA
jgi:aspartate kinase